MEKTKIGLLIPQTGPLGIWAQSCINSAILATAQANAEGGILGREVDLVIRDAGWDPDAALAAAEDMIACEDVSTIVGLIGSNSRDLVSDEISHKTPFIYTPTYEASALSSRAIAISATDNLLLTPLLAWIEGRFRARNFFLIGSDYLWARETMPMASEMITQAGGRIVGMRARPINPAENWDEQVVDEIARIKPDIMLIFLAGDQSIPFYRAFSAAGLPSTIPRCAVATDETILASLGPDSTEGLFACAHYFASIRTNPNIQFMERYWEEFGQFAPIPNAYGQSFYEGVNFSLGMMRAGRFDEVTTSGGCTKTRSYV